MPLIECMRVKSGGTARTFLRGPSFSSAANKLAFTSAGENSVVGDPAAKKRLISCYGNPRELGQGPRRVKSVCSHESPLRKRENKDRIRRLMRPKRLSKCG